MNQFFPNVWLLLKLEMALVTTIEMKFALVWTLNHRDQFVKTGFKDIQHVLKVYIGEVFRL